MGAACRLEVRDSSTLLYEEGRGVHPLRLLGSHGAAPSRSSASQGSSPGDSHQLCAFNTSNGGGRLQCRGGPRGLLRVIVLWQLAEYHASTQASSAIFVLLRDNARAHGYLPNGLVCLNKWVCLREMG